MDPEPFPYEPGRRPRGRRAILGGLLAVALVAVGFVVVRTTSSDPSSARVVAAPRGVGSSGSTASASVAGGSSGVTSSPGLQRVFVRTTDSGIGLRAYLQPTSAPASQECPAGSWCPGPECFPSVLLQIEVSNTDAAGSWGMPSNGSPAGPLEIVGSQSFGDQEGNPATVVAVRTTDQVTRVTLQLGDQTDSMAPVDGYAVLAVPSPDPNLGPGTISAESSDGAQLAPVSTADQGSSFVGGPDCQPPPPPPPPPLPPPVLPDSDGPPPADQDAAKAAIEDAYHQVFGNASLDLVEGGDQLQATVAAANAKNPTPPGIGSTVHEIKFINDHRAALIWDLVSNGNPLLANQIGFAVLVDGKWKVARETDCALLKMGGVDCP